SLTHRCKTLGFIPCSTANAASDTSPCKHCATISALNRREYVRLGRLEIRDSSLIIVSTYLSWTRYSSNQRATFNMPSPDAYFFLALLRAFPQDPSYSSPP